MKITDSTYRRLVALRDSLEDRHRTIRKEMEEIASNLEAVSRTLALLDSDKPDENENESEEEASNEARVDLTSLRGGTQIEALVKIAQHRGGRFLLSDAKRILVQAGMIKTPKNAGPIIFNVIQRSDRFRRVEPGLYELKSDKPERLRTLPLIDESEQ